MCAHVIQTHFDEKAVPFWCRVCGTCKVTMSDHHPHHKRNDQEQPYQPLGTKVTWLKRTFCPSTWQKWVMKLDTNSVVTVNQYQKWVLAYQWMQWAQWVKTHSNPPTNGPIQWESTGFPQGYCQLVWGWSGHRLSSQ